MEETIGYEALFSPEEWDQFQTEPWSDAGTELDFEDISPDGERVTTHEVTIYNPPGELAGNETKFEVECDRCGNVGAAENMIKAQAIERLHSAFVATMVDNFSSE